MRNFPYKVIDLTHVISSSSPTWDLNCGFKSTTDVNHDTRDGGVGLHTQHISMPAGMGTHIDAPAHVVDGGRTVVDLDINNLIAPCVCINVSDKASEGFQLSVSDVLNFELKHGAITVNNFVIIYTGWDQYWDQPDKYHNNYHFPSISEPAIQFLLAVIFAVLALIPSAQIAHPANFLYINMC